MDEHSIILLRGNDDFNIFFEAFWEQVEVDLNEVAVHV